MCLCCIGNVLYRLKIIHSKKESSDIVIIKDTTNSCCIGDKGIVTLHVHVTIRT